MVNSIICFEENCTKIFEKLENEFFKHPKNFAGYVCGIVDELYKLGLEILKDSLETMDKMLQQSPVRHSEWTVEAHHSKTLTTYLSDVVFQKTLFQNKETGETGKYLESTSHSVSDQVKKMAYFNAHIWML